MSANRFQTWLAKKQGRAALGVTTGFVNSLFGSGGGMLVVPALAHSGLNQRKAQATALAAILPISAFSAVGYFTQTSVPWDVTLFSAAGRTSGRTDCSVAAGKTAAGLADTYFFRVDDRCRLAHDDGVTG